MKKQLASILLLMSMLFAGACSGETDAGKALRGDIVASSENFEINGAMMSYYFYDNYNNFVDFYGNYVKLLGLDTTLPLREQEANEGQSWHDYFMDGTKLLAQNLLVLNEAARADGIELSDAEKSALQSRAERIDAAEYGVGKSDAADAMLFESSAYKYRAIKEAELAPGADEIEAYYEKNDSSYQRVDYYLFAIDYGTSSKLTEDTAGELAAELASAKTPDEFKATVVKILLAADPEITDAKLSSELEKIENRSVSYSEGRTAHEWAFGEAEVGDTYTIKSGDKMLINVYMLISEPYRDESETAVVRHILLSDDTFGGRESAMLKAEELLAQLEESGYSMETFALLALEYSDDTSNYHLGGVYRNLAPGNTIAAFNDWTFDSDRSAGDAEIIESDYGCHVMFYEGEGLVKWQASVADDIVAERMDAHTAELNEKYAVIFNDTALDKIDE